jgi:hypothetical protein
MMCCGGGRRSAAGDDALHRWRRGAEGWLGLTLDAIASTVRRLAACAAPLPPEVLANLARDDGDAPPWVRGDYPGGARRHGAQFGGDAVAEGTLAARAPLDLRVNT